MFSIEAINQWFNQCWIFQSHFHYQLHYHVLGSFPLLLHSCCVVIGILIQFSISEIRLIVTDWISLFRLIQNYSRRRNNISHWTSGVIFIDETVSTKEETKCFIPSANNAIMVRSLNEKLNHLQISRIMFMLRHDEYHGRAATELEKSWNIIL